MYSMFQCIKILVINKVYVNKNIIINNILVTQIGLLILYEECFSCERIYDEIYFLINDAILRSISLEMMTSM